MGNQSSRSVEISNALKAVQKSFNESLLKVNQKCKVDGEAGNTIRNIAEGDERVERAVLLCLNLGNDPEKCKSVMTRADMNDVMMTANANVSSECEVDSDMINELQTEMINNLKSQAQQENDEVGRALNNFIDMYNVMGRSDESSKIANTQDFYNEVVNSITLEVAQEAITNARAMNNIENIARGLSYATVNGIKMDAQVAVFMKALSKNKALSDTASKISTETDQDTKEQNKGLADVTDSFFGGVGGVVRSIGSAVSSASAGIAMIFIAIAIVALSACMVMTGGLGGGGGGSGGNMMMPYPAATGMSKPFGG